MRLLDGMGPTCARHACGLPFAWSDDYAPYCSAECARADERDEASADEAARREEMSGRNLAGALKEAGFAT